jgi:hypothetical protein
MNVDHGNCPVPPMHGARRHALRRVSRNAGAVVLLALALPAAAAEMKGDDWRFDAVIYGYFPSISGTSKFPERSGGSSVDIDSDKIIDSLKFTFMGTFEAHRGRWGVLADVLYMDLGGGKTRTRDINVGGSTLPDGVTANATLDIKGTVWELAGTYRAVNERGTTLDLVGGFRVLDYKQTLGWEFSADLGPIAPDRSGNSVLHPTNWDAIVGAKGRFAFGDRQQWFVPFYVDAGAGDSDFTWQALGGVGYSFGWGDVLGGWRYLDYRFKSGSRLEGATFSGPMVGVAFHW